MEIKHFPPSYSFPSPFPVAWVQNYHWTGELQINIISISH